MIEAYGCFDIVIRRDALERRGKGLSQKFIDKYKVTTPHYDDDIICIRGGMNDFDLQITIEELERDYDLVYNPNINELPITDMVITEGLFGIQTKNTWLIEENIRIANGIKKQFYFQEEK